MITVERIFYCVLAFPDTSDLLPLMRALRAVELHIRREWLRTHHDAQRNAVVWRERAYALQRRAILAEDELESLRAFKGSVDEAQERTRT